MAKTAAYLMNRREAKRTALKAQLDNKVPGKALENVLFDGNRPRYPYEVDPEVAYALKEASYSVLSHEIMANESLTSTKYSKYGKAATSGNFRIATQPMSMGEHMTKIKVDIYIGKNRTPYTSFTARVDSSKNVAIDKKYSIK